jgi:hypothetical protein
LTVFWPYFSALFSGVRGRRIRESSDAGSRIIRTFRMSQSQGFTLPPLGATVDPPAPTIPECNTGTPGSTVALEGTVIRGTAESDEPGTHATLPVGPVYGESVSGGSGKVKGTLDHRPLLSGPPQPPILEGALELNLPTPALMISSLWSGLSLCKQVLLLTLPYL